MSEPYFSGDSFSPGDRARQIALVGLAPLTGFTYVVGVPTGELILSMTPDGPPLTDLHGQPRHYPPGKFRKVPPES